MEILTMAWSGGAAVDAGVLVVAGAGIVAAIRMLECPKVTLPATTDWIDELSVERYRPMLQLLDQVELRFLCQRSGITPKFAAEFRRQRCRIFRGYLRSLQGDYSRICMALNLLMAQAATDRPDLASALVRSQLAFGCNLALVRVQVLFYRLGIVTPKPDGLLMVFDGLRVELRTLVPRCGAGVTR